MKRQRERLPSKQLDQWHKDRRNSIIGRPSTLREEYFEQTRILASRGLTIEQIAEFFKVQPCTIYYWKAHSDQFAEALRIGKDHADSAIERSMYDRAHGFEYTKEVIKTLPVLKPVMDPNTGKVLLHPKTKEPILREQMEIVRVPVRERVLGEPVLMIFWLKNRKKEDWRDVKRQEFSTPDGPLKLVSLNMTPQEAAEAYASQLKAIEAQ